jgi:two-component system, NarL family, nitrate/nitrite response regulator NarL
VQSAASYTARFFRFVARPPGAETYTGLAERGVTVVKVMHVLLAQHQDMLCEGLRSYLHRIEPAAAVSAARNWSEAQELLGSDRKYDLVVIDLDLPGIQGLGDVTQQKTIFGGASVAILADEATRHEVFHALESGIAAYITKDMKGTAVQGALMLAIAGERFIPSRLLLGDDAVGEGGQRGNRRAINYPLDAMTQRQAQVLKLVASGKTNAEIAVELKVAEPTVRLHLRQIYRKLGVRNRIEAMRVALRLGPPAARG